MEENESVRSGVLDPANVLDALAGMLPVAITERLEIDACGPECFRDRVRTQAAVQENLGGGSTLHLRNGFGYLLLWHVVVLGEETQRISS